MHHRACRLWNDQVDPGIHHARPEASTAMEALYYDDVHVGQTWTSDARTVTETDVVMFASLTGDFNRLHVDHAFARQTAFGKPIAHGLLGLAWVAGLGSHSPLMQTEAFLAIREWRFVKPIFLGDTVHVVTQVLEKIDSGRRRGTILWQRELRRQDDQVLQIGTFESLVAKRRFTDEPSTGSP